MADFIDIVESSRWLIDRVLSSQESDDFVNLEAGTSLSSSSSQQTPITAPGNDNILNALVNDESYTNASTSPFLSKSAEAELYLLATNFLVRLVSSLVRHNCDGRFLLFCGHVQYSTVQYNLYRTVHNNSRLTLL